MLLPTMGGTSSKERWGECRNFPSSHVAISLICGLLSRGPSLRCVGGLILVGLMEQVDEQVIFLEDIRSNGGNWNAGRP